MRAGLIFDVEPQVVGMGFLLGQEIVLPVVAAYPDGDAAGVGCQDLLGKFPLHLIFGCRGNKPHLPHFSLDIDNFRLAADVVQGVFQRVEVLEMLLVFCDELGRFLLAVAHLRVTLVIAIGVVRHGIGRFEGNGNRFLLLRQEIGDGDALFVVVLFVGVNHEQVAVKLIGIHLIRLFQFGRNALDLFLLLFNELGDALLHVFLLAVEAALAGGLIVVEVFFDGREAAARIGGQALQFQWEDDFLSLDHIDEGSRYAVKLLA